MKDTKPNNPTLGEILTPFTREKLNPKQVVSNFKNEISHYEVSPQVLNLVKKLEQEIAEKNLFDASYTLKAIKNYPIFKKNKKLQKKFKELHQLIEDGYEMEPEEKAL